jgi:predicted DNA-binding WGR domain protein
MLRFGSSCCPAWDPSNWFSRGLPSLVSSWGRRNESSQRLLRTASEEEILKKKPKRKVKKKKKSDNNTTNTAPGAVETTETSPTIGTYSAQLLKCAKKMTKIDTQ